MIGRHFEIRRLCALLLAGLLTTLAADLAFAQAKQGRVVSIHFITVESGAAEKAASILKTYADAVRGEKGNVEATALQQTDRAMRFATLEIWADDASYKAHEAGSSAASLKAALQPLETSPSDEHVLQHIADAAPRPSNPNGLYMFEHFDFPGVPEMVVAAVPLMQWLERSGAASTGALRFELYRQVEPRINHYEVVSEWTDLAAFQAYQASAVARKFRHVTDQDGPAWRVNMFDQRLYKPL